MEEQELVSSFWAEGGRGPRRRVYEITVRGREYLGQWMEVLAHRRRRIDQLLGRYEGLTKTRKEQDHGNL